MPVPARTALPAISASAARNVTQNAVLRYRELALIGTENVVDLFGDWNGVAGGLSLAGIEGLGHKGSLPEEKEVAWRPIRRI